MVEKISGQEYEARARRLANLEGKKFKIDGRLTKTYIDAKKKFYVIHYTDDGINTSRVHVMYQGRTVLGSKLGKFEDGFWKSLLTYNLKRAEELDAEKRKREAERFSGQINDSMRSFDPFGNAVRKSVGSA